MSRTALIAGATGLVGGFLLQKMLAGAQYDKVKLLARRPPRLSHAKLDIVRSDFANLDKIGDRLAADDVYCCLGTTLRKAGSRANFERVDYHMVVGLARAARKAGARRFFVVSAAGSSLRSPSFYARVKARMERAVSDVGFDATHIVRPSLLLGPRKERRPAEQIGQVLGPIVAPLLVGPFKKYRPIRADAVAEALLTLADGRVKGVQVHHLPLE